MARLENLDGIPRPAQPAISRSTDAPQEAGEAPAREYPSFWPRCLSIDLEVGRNDSRIRVLAII